MTDRQPIARVDGRPVRAVLSDATPFAVALLAALLAGIAATMTGVPGSAVGGPFGSPPVIASLAGVVALSCVGAVGVARDTREVRLYRDELTVVNGVRPFVGSLTIPYEEVDLAVRTDDRDDVATYKLVRSGNPTSTLRHVRDPETVERVLAERVPSPRTRNGRATTGDGTRRSIERERLFWRRWPSDVPLPTSAVVGASSIPAAVGSGVQFRTDAGTTEHGGGSVSDDATVEDLARGQYADPGTDAGVGRGPDGKTAVSGGKYGTFGGEGGDGGGM